MISNSFIAKIEGHGSLKVDWEKNSVKLHVDEGERLFEGILVGKTAEEAAWITPRICGVCPIAHNLATLSAVESAMGIEISETTKLLRKLMQCGQIIQSHALHLFFLALPDYIGLDRGTELAKKEPKLFEYALKLKEMADEIAYVSAGRNVHLTTTCVGGFHKFPQKQELKSLLEKIKESKEAAEEALKFFSGLEYPELKVDLELVAQVNGPSAGEAGKIVSKKTPKTSDVYRSTSDVEVDIREYKQNIEEELRDYSTAKFGKFQGREVMVGALARLAHLGERLPSILGSLSPKLVFSNPFHNNLAQAVEILLFTNEAGKIIEKLLNTDKVEPLPVQGSTLAGAGIGAIEAPRGGLYHEIHLDADNIITYANIITPTVQNLTSIEKSAQALLEQTKNLEQKKREQLLNMLIRAYDPCITCSVH
jgi:coenzyme F420-reducing hydrogenase alpha subunit